MPIDQLVAESGCCGCGRGRGDDKPKYWTRVAGRIVFSHEQPGSVEWFAAFISRGHVSD